MACSDNYSKDYFSQPRGFLTPQPAWKSNRYPPAAARSETKPRRTPDFHVVHKIPSGDSPYVRAKHVQLVDKDPNRAVSLFWAAINSGDRVESALKDMAVVMKQLDRADEAIEAIKSFRHLSPPESQDSIDNILVELYKQSGRIDEEILMLQRKLKKIEGGMAFSGKKTKIARSQGKKVQITIEKDYSRLLGNLAWAYMQQKDFKSAEEQYRKALSFEPDKNKQCNLAVCLMHMNKMTEAKFLLQTVRYSSGSDFVDETYAKSYERASQILAEMESQKETGRNDEQVHKTKSCGGHWDSRFCSQRKFEDNNGTRNSPLPSSAKTNNVGFTEFPYEKRVSFDWRRNHGEPHNDQRKGYLEENIPKVPFTQPRRDRDQRKGYFKENENGSSRRKLSFGSSTTGGSEQSFVSQNVNYYSDKQLVSSTEGDWRKNSSFMPSEVEEDEMKSLAYDDCHNSSIVECAVSSDKGNYLPATHKFSMFGKSWADMVEEEELEFSWNNNENVDCNITHVTPKSDKAEKLSQKIEMIDLGSGYLTQPEKTGLSVNQPVKQSLRFDQNHSPMTPKNQYNSSPLTAKVLDMEGQVGGLPVELGSSSGNRRRLKVFQDITSTPGSART